MGVHWPEKSWGHSLLKSSTRSSGTPTLYERDWCPCSDVHVIIVHSVIAITAAAIFGASINARETYNKVLKCWCQLLQTTAFRSLSQQINRVYTPPRRPPPLLPQGVLRTTAEAERSGGGIKVLVGIDEGDAVLDSEEGNAALIGAFRGELDFEIIRVKTSTPALQQPSGDQADAPTEVSSDEAQLLSPSAGEPFHIRDG